jgi:hypothetical protein
LPGRTVPGFPRRVTGADRGESAPAQRVPRAR